MIVVEVECKCGRVFRRLPQGMNRTRCFECSPPRGRSTIGTTNQAAAPVAAGPVSPPPAGPGAERVRGEMETAVFTELAQFGREGSVSGVAALMMARQVDNGMNTGSQLATLMAKVQSAVTAAVEGAAPVGDWLDELQRARQARHAATAAARGLRWVGSA